MKKRSLFIAAAVGLFAFNPLFGQEETCNECQREVCCEQEVTKEVTVETATAEVEVASVEVEVADSE